MNPVFDMSLFLEKKQHSCFPDSFFTLATKLHTYIFILFYQINTSNSCRLYELIPSSFILGYAATNPS